MSWRYLPERVAAFSVQGCSAGKRFVTSNETLIASRSSKPGSARAASTTPPSGMTFGPSTAGPGGESSMLSRRASLASRSAARAGEGLAAIPAICGRTPFVSLERSGPRGPYWRTLPDSSTGRMVISAEYSRTWPRAGIMLNGVAYQLQPLVPPTVGIGCGLLGTPFAMMGNLYLGRLRRTETWEKSSSLQHQLLGLVLGLTGRERYSGPRMSCHPDFAEWMMGWPIGWTALEPLETARFRRWLELSGAG